MELEISLRKRRQRYKDKNTFISLEGLLLQTLERWEGQKGLKKGSKHSIYRCVNVTVKSTSLHNQCTLVILLKKDLFYI